MRRHIHRNSFIVQVLIHTFTSTSLSFWIWGVVHIHSDTFIVPVSVCRSYTIQLLRHTTEADVAVWPVYSSSSWVKNNVILGRRVDDCRAGRSCGEIHQPIYSTLAVSSFDAAHTPPNSSLIRSRTGLMPSCGTDEYSWMISRLWDSNLINY